jgi:GNAT superfamily N-acetyltransferase/propanediol dehydratase small subunit
MTIELRRVDPEDVEAITAYTDISAESESFENPYPTPFSLDEQREDLRNRDATRTAEGYLGYVDDTPVTTGTIELFESDNRDKAWLFVNTLPSHRGRGYGATMLDFLVTSAKERDRTELLTGTNYPSDADETHPYRRFLTERGFSFVQAEVHRVLELPADDALLDELAAEAANHHADYTLVDLDELPPVEMREAYCVLLNQIMVDAPSGSIEFEEGGVTPETLVQREESARAAGRTMYRTLALDRNGVPVAHNVLAVPSTDPDKIYNLDTLVRRDHRGHRLGYATKIRNLRQVTARHPERTTVHTWNAASNAPMISVNDAMGFRPVRFGGEYVRRL